MQADVRLSFESIGSGRRGRRFYAVELGQDLFGAWLIGITHGRAGSAGRRVVLSAASLEKAWRLIMRRVRDLFRRADRDGVVALVGEVVPDVTVPAWAQAPLMPWRMIA